MKNERENDQNMMNRNFDNNTGQKSLNSIGNGNYIKD